MRYASTGGFPSLIDAGRWGGGTNFFTGGIGPSASAEQTVSVADRAASIDAGPASASLSGLLGGNSTEGDAASVSATFLGAAGQAIGTPLSIGPVTAAERRNQTVLLRRTTSAPIPAGTRSIRVSMTMTRQSNDAYLDDLSFRIAAGPPVPPIVTVAATPRCAGKSATIVARSRITRGTPRADVIRARGGNDIVCGRGGADLIEGGPGRDRLLGGACADRLAIVAANGATHTVNVRKDDPIEAVRALTGGYGAGAVVEAISSHASLRPGPRGRARRRRGVAPPIG